MTTHIVLMTLTDKGAENIETLPELLADQQTECALPQTSYTADIYATIGLFDLIAVCSFDSDEDAAKWSANLVRLGLVRTNTMRAYSIDAMGPLVRHKMAP